MFQSKFGKITFRSFLFYYFDKVSCTALKHRVPCRSMTTERTAQWQKAWWEKAWWQKARWQKAWWQKARWQKARWRSQALRLAVKCSRKTTNLRTRVNTARMRANIRVILFSICAYTQEKNRSRAHTVHAGLPIRAVSTSMYAHTQEKSRSHAHTVHAGLCRRSN